MKRYLFILLVLAFLLPAQVSAHLVGQPPFFKINGVFSNLYPVPSSSVEGFNLPQDLAVDNYLINQPLEFEFDENKMPAPKEIIEQTKFFWDFGDGTVGLGLKNSHSYPKPGSYILAIKAQYKTDPEPQLIQSVLFNVLPSKDYKLPQVVIRANGKTSRDPLNDIIKTEFSKEIELDGSTSIAGSGKILSYQWDLGDTTSASDAKLAHRYDVQLNQVFPVLRVKDENGFVADQFIQLVNGPESAGNPVTDSFSPLTKTLIYLAAAVVFIVAAFLLIKFFRRPKFRR